WIPIALLPLSRRTLTCCGMESMASRCSMPFSVPAVNASHGFIAKERISWWARGLTDALAHSGGYAPEKMVMAERRSVKTDKQLLANTGDTSRCSIGLSSFLKAGFRRLT